MQFEIGMQSISLPVPEFLTEICICLRGHLELIAQMLSPQYPEPHPLLLCLEQSSS